MNGEEALALLKLIASLVDAVGKADAEIQRLRTDQSKEQQ